MIGWEEFHRGRITHARDSAHELMQVGRALGEPRPTGLGLALIDYIAMVFDSTRKLLTIANKHWRSQSRPLIATPPIIGKGCTLVLLRQTEEGAKILDEDRCRCLADGDLYSLVASDGVMGVCRVFRETSAMASDCSKKPF